MVVVCAYVVDHVCMWINVCVCLGHSLVSKVGESFKLILVDLLDDAVVHWRQNGFFACKVLVEVVHIPFGFLEDKEQERAFKSKSLKIICFR